MTLNPEETARAHELIAKGHLLLAAQVRAGAAPHGGAPDFYTSSSKGPWPPGKSKRWALRNIRTIPGAHKVGRDWLVSHADFRTWCERRDVAQVKAAAVPTATAKNIAAAALAASGYRKAG